MSRFNIIDLPLIDLKLIERQRVGDERGFLSRLFCSQELTVAGWVKPILQINHTFTAKRGTVRGLHFQHPPYAEAKLVSCLRGEVWDVAIDIRPTSTTFLCWHAERLSENNCRALLLPEGFAHGFQTLTDEVELIYFHSAPYMPEVEAGLNPEDPRLAIAWPLVVTETSLRDRQHPMLKDTFTGVKL